jgi:hypothetical protein
MASPSTVTKHSSPSDPAPMLVLRLTVPLGMAFDL